MYQFIRTPTVLPPDRGRPEATIQDLLACDAVLTHLALRNVIQCLAQGSRRG